MSSGLILVNESSGPNDTTIGNLSPLFPGQRFAAFDSETYVELVRDAIADDASFVGVAGGDGTIRCVVQQLCGTTTALLAIPTGTRNHFARSLGIVDRELAAAAATAGERRDVDVGEVNDRCFVNNASIGLYPHLVVRREENEHTYPKPIANIAAAWHQILRGRKTTVTVGGKRLRVWTVFVGNGCYGEGVQDLATRRSLTDNILDVRVLRADRRAARIRVLGALLLGRLDRSPLILRLHTAEIAVEPHGMTTEVALDGEVETIATPLRFSSRPHALIVLVPPSGE